MHNTHTHRVDSGHLTSSGPMCTMRLDSSEWNTILSSSMLSLQNSTVPFCAWKKEHEQAYYKANKLSPARNDNVPVEFSGGGKEHEQVYHKLAVTSQKW